MPPLARALAACLPRARHTPPPQMLPHCCHTCRHHRAHRQLGPSWLVPYLQNVRMPRQLHRAVRATSARRPTALPTTAFTLPAPFKHRARRLLHTYYLSLTACASLHYLPHTAPHCLVFAHCLRGYRTPPHLLRTPLPSRHGPRFVPYALPHLHAHYHLPVVTRLPIYLQPVTYAFTRVPTHCLPTPCFIYRWRSHALVPCLCVAGEVGQAGDEHGSGGHRVAVEQREGGCVWAGRGGEGIISARAAA